MLAARERALTVCDPLSFSCLGFDTTAALLDDELDGDERLRIEAHLDECSSCRLIVADAVAGAMAPTRVEPAEASWLTTLPRERLPGEPRFAPGDAVDHFRIEGLLGRGGMGEVYLARDTRLARPVALKVVGDHLMHTPQAVERFVREARMTARLNHPNVVAIHDVGEYEGRPYLALEYIEGRTLRAWARQGGASDVRASLSVGLAVAEALADAHGRGVLHRDLKPENVLVGDDGRVRVVDFGLAEPLDTEVSEPARNALRLSGSSVVGTPRYMAPEQWSSGPTTGAADVWALGIMLYELLSGGAHPYGGEPGAPVDAQLVSLEAREAPPRVRELIERCLVRAPADRPSAEAVAAALRAALENEPRRFWLGAVAVCAVGAVLAWFASSTVEPAHTAHAGMVAAVPSLSVAAPAPARMREQPTRAARAAAPPRAPHAAPADKETTDDAWLRRW